MAREPSVSGNKKDLPVVFSAQNIRDIADALPKPVCERRRELLPQIIGEWGRADLPRHLTMLPLKIIHARMRKAKQAGQHACDLLQVLKSADDDERRYIVGEMILKGRSLEQVDPAEWNEWPNLEKQLDEASFILTALAAVASIELPSKRGQRNYKAYLVLQDAAAIFRWYTDKKPSRETDRNTGKEIGAFYPFASTLWPVVFENGTSGLGSAMKNWAAGSQRYKEVSALVHNISMRYPAWRVFDC
jgi:hypothetical protein